MKRGLFILFLIVSVFITITGCSSEKKEYFYQTAIAGVTELMEGEENGFVLIVTDTDDYFVKDIAQIANDEKVEVAMYNLYQPDGVEEVQRPNFKYAGDLQGSTLYYIVDGEINNDLKVNNYADLKLTQEVSNFMKK